jgi:hypothetical protein
MPTIIEAPKSNYVPHPEGTFIGIMRDAYLQTKPNPYKGQLRDKSNPDKGVDERETITELFMEFLTDHQVEINGKMLPGFARYKATASVAEGSNLRKFLKAWWPALKDEDFKRFDADKLVGKGAYLTVAHRVDKKGNTWANVVGAMQPPKGSALPAIPADFVRHEDREKAAMTANVTSDPPAAYNAKPQHIQGEDEDSLPF